MIKARVFTGLLLLGAACTNEEAEKASSFVIQNNFEQSAEGWTGGFADYPADQTSDELAGYQLAWAWTDLPSNITPTQKGIRISGNNRSDDLFMFIKRKVTGLPPNTRYQLQFRLTLASNAPAGAVGVGGAPGEAVWIKVGAASKEPQAIRVVEAGLPMFRMNIDKGIQSQSGENAMVIGNIAVTENTTSFTLIDRLSTAPFVATTSSEGDLWLIIGTDSGFEAFTQLYYAEVQVTGSLLF